MEFEDAKKLIRKVGVKSWLEAGTNVVEVGDKLLDSTDTFSRLDFYRERKNTRDFSRGMNCA